MLTVLFAGVPSTYDLEESAAKLCRDLGLKLPEQNGDLAMQSFMLRAGLPQVKPSPSLIF